MICMMVFFLNIFFLMKIMLQKQIMHSVNCTPLISYLKQGFHGFQPTLIHEPSEQKTLSGPQKI